MERGAYKYWTGMTTEGGHISLSKQIKDAVNFKTAPEAREEASNYPELAWWQIKGVM